VTDNLTTPSAGRRFRQAMLHNPPLQIVGVPAAYCALLAQQAGVEALYLSGAAVSNMAFGRADLGYNTREEIVEEARRITAVSTLPLLVDADTGLGEGKQISQTVIELEQVGAAGLHIEDQVELKRCGHREGKQLVSCEEMQARIALACEARHDADFIIMARCDAVASEGLSAAIDRSLAYIQSGADMVFIEALSSLQQYREFVSAINVPVLANLTEFGVTPVFSREQMHTSGVQMLLYPLSAFRLMSQAALELYQSLINDGTQTAWLSRMQTRDALYTLLDYHSHEAQQDAQHRKD